MGKALSREKLEAALCWEPALRDRYVDRATTRQ
jgi:hypothetical protein